MLLPKQKSCLSLSAFILAAALPMVALAADDVRPVRTISVAADAETTVKPDRVTLNVGVKEQAKTVAEAQKKTNEQLKALERVTKDLSIPADKVQTTYSSTQPQYRWESKTNKRIFEGYEVNHQIRIFLDEPEKLATLMEKLTAGGIDEINNVSYGLKDEQEAKIEALKKASVNARAKAQAVAGALGEKLGKLVSINEGGTHYQPIPIAYARAAKAEMLQMDAGAAPPSPPSGGITINSNVQATFALQD
jgi:uncharacterized protein YggE